MPQSASPREFVSSFLASVQLKQLDALDPGATLTDIGVDSLQLVLLVTQIEQLSGKELTVAEITKISAALTVGHLLDAVDAAFKDLAA